MVIVKNVEYVLDCHLANNNLLQRYGEDVSSFNSEVKWVCVGSHRQRMGHVRSIIFRENKWKLLKTFKCKYCLTYIMLKMEQSTYLGMCLQCGGDDDWVCSEWLWLGTYFQKASRQEQKRRQYDRAKHPCVAVAWEKSMGIKILSILVGSSFWDERDDVRRIRREFTE